MQMLVWHAINPAEKTVSAALDSVKKIIGQSVSIQIFYTIGHVPGFANN